MDPPSPPAPVGITVCGASPESLLSPNLEVVPLPRMPPLSRILEESSQPAPSPYVLLWPESDGVPESTSVSVALVGGLTAAGVVVLVVAALVCCFLLRRRRRERKELPLSGSRAVPTVPISITEKIEKEDDEAPLYPYASTAKGGPEGLLEGAIQPKNKRFNSSDIARITDQYSKVLGKGGFGTVYYGVLQDGSGTAVPVAVKVLNNTSTITIKQFCTEAELLMRIHHVNLVTLIGYCDEPANMALVYEYMSCGDLHAQLSEKNKNPLTWEARLRISVDAARGLEYLHSDCRPPIIHRDIKPANILLDKMGHAKIADFGLSRFFTTDSGATVRTDLAGTRGYLDPEYYQPINALSKKSDVYAIGVVLLQLLTGQPVFIKNTNHVIHITEWVSPKVETGDMLALIDKRLQEDDLIVNSARKFLDIALKCVKRAGNERPTMSEVVADLKACMLCIGGMSRA